MRLVFYVNTVMFRYYDICRTSCGPGVPGRSMVCNKYLGFESVAGTG
jgi:hypothetical protein